MTGYKVTTVLTALKGPFPPPPPRRQNSVGTKTRDQKVDHGPLEVITHAGTPFEFLVFPGKTNLLPKLPVHPTHAIRISKVQKHLTCARSIAALLTFHL